MGLLDSVIGAALGQGGAGGAGGTSGGGNAALLQAVIALLGNGPQGSGGGGLGGIGGLLSQLQQSGLGDVASSWVSTGQNLPISPDQLGGALGNDTVSSMASQLGMGEGDLLGQLSHMLPQVVDHLTPNGQLPETGGGADLGSLLGGLLGR